MNSEELAGSGGGCNEGSIGLGWCLPVEYFAGAAIELDCDALEMLSGDVV